MSGPASVGPPGSGLPPPPYPGFSPSHSPASASAPGSVGAPHLPPSPQFYPPKPSPSSVPSSLLASQLQHQSPHYMSDQQEKERLRFQIELEFVQCLGNPNYLNFLAQRGYFKDSTFINYIKYLQYWKEPAYVKFIKYPVCLHFLELLQHEAFRKEVVNAQVFIFSNATTRGTLSLNTWSYLFFQCTKFLDDQTILHWQHYSRKRAKLVENAVANHTASVGGTPSSNAPSHQSNVQASVPVSSK